MIVEFPARQWKWYMLFDLLRIIESTGFAKRLSGSDYDVIHSFIKPLDRRWVVVPSMLLDQSELLQTSS